jgi:hypothetical protein
MSRKFLARWKMPVGAELFPAQAQSDLLAELVETHCLFRTFQNTTPQLILEILRQTFRTLEVPFIGGAAETIPLFIWMRIMVVCPPSSIPHTLTTNRTDDAVCPA